MEEVCGRENCQRALRRVKAKKKASPGWSLPHRNYWNHQAEKVNLSM